MPRVDFYILDADTSEARLTVACRIAEKAMLSKLRVWVLAGDTGEAKRLDDLLWTFSQGSFVPHRIATGEVGDDAVEPVLIGAGEPPSTATVDMLINLAAAIPDDIARYRRIAEVVDGDAARRQLGREHFREYRDRGCTPDSHDL